VNLSRRAVNSRRSSCSSVMFLRGLCSSLRVLCSSSVPSVLPSVSSVLPSVASVLPPCPLPALSVVECVLRFGFCFCCCSRF
jgi:hypothetical protein